MGAEYPLKALLALRGRRCDEAQQQLRERRSALQQAAKAVEQAGRELEEYISWKAAEIERRYQAIMEKVMTQQQLAEFHHSLGALDLQQNHLEEALAAARKKREQATAQLQAAQQELNVRRKAQLKLEQHQAVWQVEQRRREEYQADLELEDFTVKKADL